MKLSTEYVDADGNSRSPCRERGLKLSTEYVDADGNSRSPCRERGLKCCTVCAQLTPEKSLPVQGAWIEISAENIDTIIFDVAPRAGSVD